MDSEELLELVEEVLECDVDDTSLNGNTLNVWVDGCHFRLVCSKVNSSVDDDGDDDNDDS